MQQLAWQISITGILIVAAAFLFVVIRSGHPAEYGPIKERFYRFRVVWFLALLAIGTWFSVQTLTSLPYAATHDRAEAAPDITVSAVAHQWYWDIDRTELPVGETIEFQVTSADVNHSFAIYDEKERVVTQTQAMPDYVNKLRHSFEEPGTYRVMCLEYCGIAHHNMTMPIQVTAEE